MKVLMLANNMISDTVMTAALTVDGCNMVQTGSAESAVALLAANKFDVVVVDLRPDLWGRQAISKLRIAQVELPILFVSACSTADAIESAYDAGADDVVTLSIDERRLRDSLTSLALMRDEQVQTRSFSVGPLEIGLIDHKARVDGKPIALSASEYRALTLLACRTPDTGHVADHGDIEGAIVRLRRKLAKAGARDVISNIRGLGYTLGASCTVHRAAPAALRHAA